MLYDGLRFRARVARVNGERPTNPNARHSSLTQRCHHHHHNESYARVYRQQAPPPTHHDNGHQHNPYLGWDGAERDLLEAEVADPWRTVAVQNRLDRRREQVLGGRRRRDPHLSTPTDRRQERANKRDRRQQRVRVMRQGRSKRDDRTTAGRQAGRYLGYMHSLRRCKGDSVGGEVRRSPELHHLATSTAHSVAITAAASAGNNREPPAD